jgi:hypothetical protein
MTAATPTRLFFAISMGILMAGSDQTMTIMEMKLMNISDAFEQLSKELNAAGSRGIKPSIRSAGKDWVCTIEDGSDKFVMIAKEKELMVVKMRSKPREPDVQRVDTGDQPQQAIIERIEKTIAEAYGTLSGK